MPTIASVRSHLGTLVSRAAQGERIPISRHGKPVAALVPIDDADFMDEREEAELAKLAKTALREKGKWLVLDDARDIARVF
jgi:prevent-host-death family protein